MKLFVTLLIFICAVMGITSCQKEFNDPNLSPVDPVIPPIDTTVTTPPHDSVTLLSKLILMNSQVVNDTSAVHEYLYDSLHRVTTINYYVYSFGQPVINATSKYFYNGNDSLAFKMVHTEPDPDYNETTYYFYNADNTIAKDSIIFSGGIQVNNFIYTSSSITDSCIIYYDIDPATPVLYMVKGYLDVSSNIVHSITTGDNFNYVENTFTYDKMANPFARLNIHSTYHPIPGYDFYLYDNYLLKNNVSIYTEEEVIAQGPKISTTYSYTYNSMGMPASVLLSTDYGTVTHPSILFQYKKI